MHACGFVRVETVEHGLGCFARLVRLLLGADAIEESKLGCGARLGVLGVDITMSLRGFLFQPEPDKCKRWMAEIKQVLESNRLSPGMQLSVCICVRACGAALCWQVRQASWQADFRGVARSFSIDLVVPC